MAVEHGLQALLQALGGGFSAEAEIEIDHQRARNHVAGAGAAVDVADLPVGGRKEIVAAVPFNGHQLGQRRCQPVDGVLREVRVGDVALHALYGQLAAHGAAPAVLDHVAGALDRGGLADDAVVGRFATRGQPVADVHGAVVGGAFFVAGQQETDGITDCP